jgi:hypothetical protein
MVPLVSPDLSLFAHGATCISISELFAYGTTCISRYESIFAYGAICISDLSLCFLNGGFDTSIPNLRVLL